MADEPVDNTREAENRAFDADRACPHEDFEAVAIRLGGTAEG